MSDVLVIIPAHDEEGRIGKVIDKVMTQGYHVIVVDDASTDGTSDEASRHTNFVEYCNVLGKGAAMAHPFRNQTAFHVNYYGRIGKIVFIDGDGQYDADEIPYLLAAIDAGADYVVGSRREDDMPLRHMIANRLMTALFNMLNGSCMPDVTSGFYAMRTAIAYDIDWYHAPRGYTIDTHLMHEILRMTGKIAWCRVNVRYDRKSGIVRGMRMTTGIVVGMIRDWGAAVVDRYARLGTG